MIHSLVKNWQKLKSSSKKSKIKNQNLIKSKKLDVFLRIPELGFDDFELSIAS